MLEKDLLAAYRKRLEFYQKKFNRHRVFPFTQIKIKEGDKKKISAEIFLKLYEHDFISIPSKYSEISDEIIDFASLISFLPSEFRLNHIYKIMFLLQFKNSDKTLIKDIWGQINTYVSKKMIEIVLSDFLLRIFLNIISLNEFIFEFIAGINPIYLEDVFFAIFVNWVRVIFSKKTTIGTIRNLLEFFSNLYSFGDYIEKSSQFLEKNSFSIFPLVINHSRIGFEYFFILVVFSDKSKPQNILEKYFYQIPFFSHFLFLGNICQFVCFIPENFKITISNYLKSLQLSGIIVSFSLKLIIESKFEIKFENTLKRDQNIHDLMPFTSKKFKNLLRTTKKLPEIALVNLCQTYPKTIQPIDPDFNILMYFLFFNIEKLLIKNETIHDLIEKDKTISSLRFLSSSQIRKSYEVIFDDILDHLDDRLTIKELKTILKNKYPNKKSIGKLITLFKVLNIPDTSYLKRDFFNDYMLKIGNEFSKYFTKRSEHSMNEINNIYDKLIEKGYLKKYIPFDVFLLADSDRISIYIWAKSTSELEKCLFHTVKWINKNSMQSQFFLTSDTYLLFLKFLLKENLISIGIPYLFKSPVFDFGIVSFFDFDKRIWDDKKMQDYLQSLLKDSPRKKKTLKRKLNFPNWQDKLPMFQFSDFFKDLGYINKLKKISKNSDLNRKKIIEFFKNYIENHRLNFNLITDQFDFNAKLSIFPILENKERVFVIISQPGTNINPFILRKIRIFSILFSKHLQKGWYFGGSLDNILILEYLINKEDLKNKESEWNINLEAIKTKYPELNLKVYELKEDLRFFSEQSLYSHSWYYDDYNYLKQSPDLELDDLAVKNEISFRFDSTFRCKEYHPNFLPWEFWQIIGYPVSVSIITECPQEDLKLIKKIITKLPAGQIFTFKKDKKSKKTTLLGIVQLKNNIDRFIENLIPVLNDLDCVYSISLIFPLSLYEDELIG